MDLLTKDMILLVMAIVGFLFGLFQFFTKQTSAHNKEILTDHNVAINKNAKDIQDLSSRLTETRESLHKEYVRKEDLEFFSSQIRKLFHLVEGMAKDLNKLIGASNEKDGK